MERFGAYELIRHIATGGMAEIFLARHASGGLERTLVIKRMLPELAVRPDFVAMFLDEARLTANFHHPNVVKVEDLGQADTSYFIAMELVDGPHLGAMFAHSLRARRPLPIDLCAWIVARSADGLHYAHDVTDPATGRPLNLVHRDISPQNILVSKDGEVKVTDFGVAKASNQQTKTRTGIVKGKVSYMSPEQCLGEVVDRRTDVFALGIVLYELLTRRRLFKDKSDLLVMQRITNEDVAPPSSVNANGVDAALDAIVQKAMSRRLDARYQTAADFAEALDGWLGLRRADGMAMQQWFESHCPELAPSRAEAHEPTQIAPKEPAAASAGTPSFGTSPRKGPVPEETRALSPSPSPSSAGPVGVEAQPVEQTVVAAPHPDMLRDLPGATPRDQLAVSPTKRPSLADDDSGTGHSERVEVTVAAPLAVIAVGAGPTTGDADPEGNPSGLADADSVLTPMVSGVLQPTSPRPGSRTIPAPSRPTGLPKPMMMAAAAAAAIMGVLLVAVVIAREDPPARTPLPAIETPPTDTPPVGAVEAGTGTLTVNTVPPGAVVVVGDRVVGPAPVTVERPAGTFLVQAQFEGQPPRSKDVDVEAGVETNVQLEAWVPLTITSSPSKAKVRLDGELLGETPFDRGYLLEPGSTHELRLDGPSGYQDEVVKISVEAGKPVDLSLSLNRGRRPVSTSTSTSTPAEGMGALSMRTAPWTVVRLGNKVFAETDFAEKALPAGRHVLTLQNPEEGLKDKITVTIQKGKTLVVILRYQKQGGRWKVVQKTIR